MSLVRTRYLSGSVGAHIEGEGGVAQTHGIGVLLNPRNHYHLRLQHYPAWAADCGAVSKHGFDAEAFRVLLARPELAAHRATCLFVVAPDAVQLLPTGAIVGDARGTLEKFPAWAAEIRALGFPVALVAQDGLEHMVDEVPWDLVDVLFIGGSTKWKESIAAGRLVDYARSLGKRTHMGRVNSLQRLARAQVSDVDSVDGTFLSFAPQKNVPRLLAWLNRIHIKFPPSIEVPS